MLLFFVVSCNGHRWRVYFFKIMKRSQQRKINVQNPWSWLLNYFTCFWHFDMLVWDSPSIYFNLIVSWYMMNRFKKNGSAFCFKIQDDNLLIKILRSSQIRNWLINSRFSKSKQQKPWRSCFLVMLKILRKAKYFELGMISTLTWICFPFPPFQWTLVATRSSMILHTK